MAKRSKGSSALSKAAEALVDQISSEAQSSKAKEQALLDLLSPATSAQQPTPVLIDPADPLHKALEKVSLDELLKAFPPKDLPRNQ